MHFKNPSTSQEELKEKLPFNSTPEDRILREKMWPKFDLNNNNLISFSEFDQGLDREFGGNKNTFPRAVRLRAFEAARNKVPSSAPYSRDYVSRKEFRFLLLYLRKYQEIWVAFNKLDDNQDARISKEEFLKSKANLQRWGVDMSDPSFTWASIDRDGSGRIHFYEFAHWVIKQQIDKDKNQDADAEETKNIQIRIPFKRQNVDIENADLNSNDYADEDYNRRKNQLDSVLYHQSRIQELEVKKNSPQKNKNVKKSDPNKVKLQSKEEHFLDLRDENIQLKRKQVDLEDEVKLIATKLKRQITQLKKDRVLKAGGSGGAAYSAKIDEQMDKIIEENFELQERERDLRKKVKKLNLQRDPHLMISGASERRKLESTMDVNHHHMSTSMPNFNSKATLPHGHTTEFLNDLENTRFIIEKQNREIFELKQDIEMHRGKTGGSIGHMPPSEDTKLLLRHKELEFAQQKARVEDLVDNLKIRSSIFTETHTLQEKLIEELKQLNSDNLNLESQSRVFEDNAKQTEYLNQRIEEVRIERDKLQRQFDTLTKTPFFSPIADQSTFKRITELEKKVGEKERGIMDAKDSILKAEEKLREINEETRQIKGEKDNYSDELSRLQTQLDPSTMSLVDIQKKIQELDPSLFRQVMKDLHYDGEDPAWAKVDFLEKLNLNSQAIDEKDPSQLRREIQRLKEGRRDLANELERTQNLLKMQVSIDRESAEIHQQEIRQLDSEIKRNNLKIAEQNSLLVQLNNRLINYTKQLAMKPGHSLTAADLEKIDRETEKLQKINREEDMLSEFSGFTDETEVGTMDNFFDLLVSKATFDRSRLAQILGNKEILPSAVQTFVTIDFYNHDTRNSELAEGFEANYQTQFSFKNQVDNFYLQHLENSTATVEFFITRAQNAIKIGSAKIILRALINKDTSPQFQDIIYEGAPGSSAEIGGGILIGRLSYKMRMRKAIDKALMMYNQKKTLQLSKDPVAFAHLKNQKNQSINAVKPRSKLISITVKNGKNLQRPEDINNKKEMMPFFHFQFYTYEYTSPVSRGSNPIYDIRQQYEVAVDDQFIEYMRMQTLKIDLIDEAVDIQAHQTGPAKDYIGTVRVPMQNFLLTNPDTQELSQYFQVIDMEGRVKGDLLVVFQVRDYSAIAEGISQLRGGGTDAYFTKVQEKEIISKIADKFADTLLESIDMIFDMLIAPGSYDSSKISTLRFKDYIMDIGVDVREQDILMFIKSNQLLAGKEFIELKDFITIFENPVRQAKEKKQEQALERSKMLTQAQHYFKQNEPTMMSPGFERTITPAGRSGAFDQSINQRAMNDTAAFRRQQSNTASTIDQNKFTTLHSFLKENVYTAVQKFRDVAGGENCVNFDQFKKAMLDFCKNTNIPEIDMVQFWTQYKTPSDRFYFEEQLMQIYGNAPVGQIRQDTAHYNRYAQKSANPTLILIKKKLQDHLIKSEIELSHLFAYIDRDNSKSISIQEFTKGLNTVLTAEECRILFLEIDVDNDNSLSYQEIINSLQHIYTAQILFKLRGQIDRSGGKVTVESIFKTADNNNDGVIDVVEFYEQMQLQVIGVTKQEVDLLFQHFDKKGRGKLSLEEFKNGLYEQVDLEGRMRFYLQDFMVPLQTVLKQLKLKNADMGLHTIFSLFAKGDKKTLSVEDFKEMVLFYLKIELTEDEEKQLRDYIVDNYRSKTYTLDHQSFNDFLSQNFKINSFDKGNAQIAQETQKKVKLGLRAKILSTQGTTLEILLRPYMDEQTKSMTLRALKVFLMVNLGRTIPPYEIENLAAHLDGDGDGFITWLEIERELSFSNNN